MRMGKALQETASWAEERWNSRLSDDFAAVRRATEELCAPLSAEDQMLQPMPEASPAKWHQAHTTWFFDTFILAPHQPGYRAFDARFTHLFNSYYKQVQEGHPVRATRGLFSRPSLEEVRAYRRHVDEHMLRLLRADEVSDDLATLVEIGLNHEQQHQELILTDVKYAFWMSPLRPAYATLTPAETAPTAWDWLSFDGGLHEIGHAGAGFAFDNEGPRHTVHLQLFRLASRLVTNAEYLGFMHDGGYRRSELWLSDGWDTVVAQGWRAPLYWEERDGQWFCFTVGGWLPVAPHEPVCHVSYYEADAYARWAGARLPTEFEWEVAASSLPVEGNLQESRRFHPASAAGGSGLQQMFGDVWEWTSSPYIAYPAFRPAEGALGEYNGKFMCNQIVLRGGSCATPSSHLRASYRNFFPPQARWQFSGIRLAQ
jgi:ergothioneine biosynthesis protein EgtB